MKAILGGKDAQSVENFRAYYPDFKIANNCFKIVEELVLEFGGEEILPFIIIPTSQNQLQGQSHKSFHSSHHLHALFRKI